MSREFAAEYARVVAELPRLGKFVESLIRDLLKSQNIKFHSVSYRVKEEDSAADKLARKVADSGEQRTLESLTDMLGLRVITYFEDEVDAVAELIAREFLIDQENTVNKSAALDPDRFGYMSMHYIAQLSEARARLPENHAFMGVKFEIQIRSILQHAWAEIEHDLGYKAEAVPRTVKRRFSRLAGLLELADDEFVGIRGAVFAHQKATKKTIERGALAIDIDQDSLSAFVQSHQQIGRLDRAIARSISATLQKRPDDEFIGRQAAQLVELGFASIEDLSNYLDKEWEVLKRFIQARISRAEHAPRNKRLPIPLGIGLYWVGLLRHTQEVEAGNKGIPAYSGTSIDSLLGSLDSARAGSEPLPGV